MDMIQNIMKKKFRNTKTLRRWMVDLGKRRFEALKSSPKYCLFFLKFDGSNGISFSNYIEFKNLKSYEIAVENWDRETPIFTVFVDKLGFPNVHLITDILFIRLGFDLFKGEIWPFGYFFQDLEEFPGEEIENVRQTWARLFAELEGELIEESKDLN
jgi:hypothetical protein